MMRTRRKYAQIHVFIMRGCNYMIIKVNENRYKFACSKYPWNMLLNISQRNSYNIYCLTKLISGYNMELLVVKSKFQVLLVPN